MMKLTCLSIGLCLLTGSAWGGDLPHEQIHSLPVGWALAGRPRDDAALRLQVNLVQENLSLLETALRSVSDPDSSCYGHYLDREEVESLFSPSQRAREAVVAWLLESGVPDQRMKLDRRQVSIDLDVQHANRIFNTTFHSYTDGHVEKTRTMRYHIPEFVSEYIHSISPTVSFGKSSALAAASETARLEPRRKLPPPPSSSNRNINSISFTDLSACQTYWTPKCLQHIYNTTDYHADPSSGSKVAFAAFLNDTASVSDVRVFEDLFSLPRSNFTMVSVDGGNIKQDPSEAYFHVNDLDVFSISSVTQNALPIIEYSVGGPPPPFTPNAARPHISDNDNEPYLRLFEYLLSRPNSELPQVITASYSEDEQTVPIRYAQRVCDAAGMLGLRGVSVIHTMAGAGPGISCLSNDGKNQSQLTPQFPASCPWITTVGETNQTDPLTTWNVSSGGFSWRFPRPWYQRHAVDQYVNTEIDAETWDYYRPLVNERGRASPDLSLQGFATERQGVWTTDPTTSHFSGGTRGNSALAGIVGLLNDARFRAGLPSMGFLNPWLYKHGTEMLTDITRGGSLGCMGRNIQFSTVFENARRIPWIGWNATVGWDPASGLGFPDDFEKLRLKALDFDRARFGGRDDWCPYRWWEIGMT